MPITKPSIGDPTKKTLADAIIDGLAAVEVDVAAIVGERLVTNGSFEVDSDSDGFPDQWTRTLYTGGAFSLVSDTGTGANSAHGLKAIKFTHPGGGGNGGGEIVSHADTYIEVSPLRPYYVTWANKNSVSTVTNSVEVLEYDATLTLLATTVIYSSTACPTTWTILGGYWVPGSSLTRYVKLKFKCGETSQSTACDIFVDNVKVSIPTLGLGRMQFTTAVTSSVRVRWQCPPDVQLMKIKVIGGGGGGDSESSGASHGGGAGGCAEKFFPVSPGVTYVLNYVVGAGGGPSANGTASSCVFGTTTLIGNGGTGSPGVGSVGTGGTATGGDINTTGGDGTVFSGTTGGDGGVQSASGFYVAGALNNANGATPPDGSGGGGAGNGAGTGSIGGTGGSGGVFLYW